MRFLNLVGLVLAGATASNAATSCAPSSSDAAVLEFAWGLADFIGGYYNSTVDSNFPSNSRNATVLGYKKILSGLSNQNTLSVEAIDKASSSLSGFQEPQCSFTYPQVNTTAAWAYYAYQFESTVTGAFIALAGYTQSPEVSFLMARLAAEHNGHATFIGSRVNSTLFADNATSLVSAYGPNQVISNRNATGSLGQYLGGCLTAPSSPCGPLRIGPLDATPSSSAGASSTASPSSTASSAAKKHH
ncbi:hypothetical protein PENANT_c003G10350 [Penicillium antarcticum]|uniref:Uncharacterized protein n=1 Tax=Penicillium antarcticum TaxID=416450 RepID=A0A1V6QIN6_9EURO|nr:uncharacterized protein N7508_005767 [Penicillium antarcticum]KAJ5306752.1 hypothetical protein N7508_005767 [Penicillium antarcticum]OQD89088.1 hypothetical protein PENANT_c003G10350 [Penicillium antarcticum]